MEIEAGRWTLRSPPREAIRVRESQQGDPFAVRRMRRGGTPGVTCHGRSVAVLAPPAQATASLVIAERATPAPRGHGPLPGAGRGTRPEPRRS